jgi:hypothetical protein
MSKKVVCLLALAGGYMMALGCNLIPNIGGSLNLGFLGL